MCGAIPGPIAGKSSPRRRLQRGFRSWSLGALSFRDGLSLAVEEGTWTGQMDNDRGGRSRLWHLSPIVVEGNRLLFTATLVRGSLPRRVTINWGITMRQITVDVILDGNRFLGEWRGYGSLSGRFSGTRR